MQEVVCVAVRPDQQLVDLRRLERHGGVGEQLQRSEYAGERGTKLVRDLGDEIGLLGPLVAGHDRAECGSDGGCIHQDRHGTGGAEHHGEQPDGRQAHRQNLERMVGSQGSP